MTVSPSVVNIHYDINDGTLNCELDGKVTSIPDRFLFEPIEDYKKYLKDLKKRIEPKKKTKSLFFNIKELMTNEFNK